MKKLWVAAVLMVSGLAMANPVDLTQDQLICSSAVPDVAAVLLTDKVAANGQTNILYGEDVNQDGQFSEDEFSMFAAVYSTSSSNTHLTEIISGLNGAEAFDTIQEITAESGNLTVNLIYGFSADGYDVDFALLLVADNSAQGAIVFALPLVCQAYVPGQ